ncbi:MAG: hypothetical protein N3J91_01000 [Verrucomicrobiae bacterium]|nr:hypothetical protein [Verrucomicrobiae bacterium]
MDEVKTGARWPEAPGELPGAGLPGLAHDLSSWLTPVKTCLQLWETGQVEKAAALRSTALQNLRTVMDCLAWVREGAAGRPAAMAPVKLRALLKQAVADCDGLLRDKQLEVDLAPGPEVEVLGDSWLLRRLFLNLFNNAAHASPAGGRVAVQVETSATAAGGVQVSLRNACLPAAAGGIGEEAMRQRLGLRISQEICRLHQGQMDLVCEEAAQAVTVIVSLPRAQADA